MKSLYVIEMKTEEVALPISITLPGLLSNWRKTTDEEILELLICEPDIGSSLWAFNLNNYQVEATFRIPTDECVSLDAWSQDGQWIVSGERTSSLKVLAVESGCQYQVLDEYRLADVFWLPKTVTLP